MARSRSLGSSVMAQGAIVILAALAFHGWLLAGSWFRLDDFFFIQRSLGAPPSWSFLVFDHAGHLMPAGNLLSWVNARLDALGFWLPATELLVMLAIALAGLLRVLVTLFGSRRAILAPLVVFAFSPILLPATTWWAAGVNQIPALAAILWGLHFVVRYLRTEAQRDAVYAVAVTLAGLLFSERAMFAFEFYAVIALCYFAAGGLRERVSSLWRTHGRGVILLGGLAVGYLACYATLTSTRSSLDLGLAWQVAERMAGTAFPVAALGGPGTWASVNVYEALVDPSNFVKYGAWLVLAVIVAFGNLSRSRSLRAWLLVLVVLGSQILLVSSSRAALTGPEIGLELRYQTETAAAFALALGLAFLPVVDSVESAALRQPHWYVDSPRLVALSLAAGVAFATVSAHGYAAPRLQALSAETFFDTFEASLADHDAPAAMADLPVPARIMSPFGAPTNSASHMFLPFGHRLSFPESVPGDLLTTDDDGRLTALRIDPLRRNVPGTDPDCGYHVETATTIPLDGPVMGYGWFVRIGYLSTAASPVDIRLGDQLVHSTVDRGLGAVTVVSTSAFDDVRISGLATGVSLCTDEVTVGGPTPTQGATS